MKIINDNVFGPIVLLPVNWLFIDTRPFQRLRNLTQLGMTPWVYPTGCHKRFEHSIGTAYLAGRLAANIQQSQPELDINEQDLMCAELAGLLHDIGHGPFSHCWDTDVLPALGVKYPHEKASINIIDWLLDKDEGALRKRLEDEFDLNGDHIRVVKEMIYGCLPGNTEKFYASSEPKSFLYDIVSNSFCGLDVDKLDYLARDGRALGTISLHLGDLERIMLTARVILTKEPDGNKEKEGYHVVWRDVTASSLHNVFHLRHRLHCIAYKHKTTVCVQIMFCDAMTTDAMKRELLQAYDTSDPNDHKLKIDKFLKLTDNIFWDTLNSESVELSESREILEQIESRKLYRALSCVRIKAETMEEMNLSEEAIEEELRAEIDKRQDIKPEDKQNYKRLLVVKKCKFTFGSTSEKRNPLDHLQYKNHSGENIESSKNCHASFMYLPQHFAEFEIRLYSRNRSCTPCNDVLKETYKSWSKERLHTNSLNY